MKLFATDEWSEKFATRMPYFALLARIQSAAAMTSLVFAMPLSSMTSSETIFAVGAAPALAGETARGDAGHERAVTATVARRVAGEGAEVDAGGDPTGELGRGCVDARVDDGDRRRRGCRAISRCRPVPRYACDVRPLRVRWPSAESRTRESAVIAVTCLSACEGEDLRAREVDGDAVDGAEVSGVLEGEAEDVGDRVCGLVATLALDDDLRTCWPGRSEPRKEGRVRRRPERPLGRGPQMPPSGTTSVRTSVARSAVRRLPFPQSAFEREPVPRFPLPQSALARTPLLIASAPHRSPLAAVDEPGRTVGTFWWRTVTR